jgi:hypothetical protein
MPSTSKKQKRLFDWALAMKKGDAPKVAGPAGKIASTLSKEKIKDFTVLKRGK